MKHLLSQFSSRIVQAKDVLNRFSPSQSPRQRSSAPAANDSGQTSPSQPGPSTWLDDMDLQPGLLEAEPAPYNSAWQNARRASRSAWASAMQDLPLQERAKVSVGAQIWDTRQLPATRPVHISAVNKLVAVVNLATRKVAVRQDIDEQDLGKLSAQSMLASAATKPAGFAEFFICDLIWLYGLHDPAALAHIPPEVGSRPLQLRRLPSVTPQLLQPRHTALLGHLLQDRLNFEQLLERTQIPAHQLCQDLAALVMTRAVKPV
jgi:hypothetical protein